MTELTTQSDFDLVRMLEAHTLKLNEQPDKKWLKDTPDKKAKYIPIAILENQLRTDFNGLVQFTILSERRELNEYIVTARIEVFHPIARQWLKYDGIGSVVIMQDKDAKLDEFNTTKKKNALVMNAPKAYAEAIKNAAKKIGIKYGANLNREFEEAYEPENLINDAVEEVLPKLQECKSIQELNDVWNLYPSFHTSTKFKVFFSNRKKELQ